MEMSPQRVRSAEFKTVRKGADPDEVRVFLERRRRRTRARAEPVDRDGGASARRGRPAAGGVRPAAAAAGAGAAQVDASGRRVRDDQPHAAARPAHGRHHDRRGAQARPTRSSVRATTRRRPRSTRRVRWRRSCSTRPRARPAGPARPSASSIAERGRGAQGPTRLPRVRRRPTRTVPRRPARPSARRGHVDPRHRRACPRRPRRRSAARCCRRPTTTPGDDVARSSPDVDDVDRRRRRSTDEPDADDDRARRPIVADVDARDDCSVLDRSADIAEPDDDRASEAADEPDAGDARRGRPDAPLQESGRDERRLPVLVRRRPHLSRPQLRPGPSLVGSIVAWPTQTSTPGRAFPDSRRTSSRGGRRTTRSRPRSTSAQAGEHGANEFVFYDGPPFANGLPHYGHLLTGYVKDVVPRYQTMRGRRVERRFGWDCHGLPAEVEAEKELGISGHPGDHRRSASTSSTTPAAPACCATPTSGSATSPARPAGSTSTTTTRPSTSPTWRASCGRSRRCGTRA